MKYLALLLIALVFLSACDTELGHESHDHDGDGHEDHAPEEHEDHEAPTNEVEGAALE
jgi:hypothetical protein